MLRVQLGLLAHKKPTIEHLREYSVTSTYYEVRRFKILSIVSNTESSHLTGFYAKNGLIHVTSDNFDAHTPTEN